jgi:polyisoprenoid-binding protein YceI
MLRTTALAAIVGLAALPVLAEPQAYVIDDAHTDVMFSWSHIGFSTTRGIAWNVEGEIMFDEENPENSSVNVSIPVDGISVTPEFEQHLLQSGDFFPPEDPDPITFTSSSITVTGETTADITGDLTVNGVTREVTLATTLNKMAPGPQGKPIAGFTATTMVDRTNFGLDLFAPFVGAEVEITINLEASPADA